MTDKIDRAPSGRVRDMDSLRALQKQLASAEGARSGLGMTLGQTDYVVTPFGKSGTTWLQQIAHTLRTRGDLDFEDISAVVPWIEVSADLGIDLNEPQKASPRVFKSHLDAERIPSGGRYIIAIRDPRDALYSMYKFMEGWFLEPGAVSLDDFARGSYLRAANSADNPTGDYWSHLISWWLRRDDPDVLLMAYEHMKPDLTGTISKVASFMEIDLDEELLAITEEHASLGFMQKHSALFDDKLMRQHMADVAGLPLNSDASKVRAGQVGESRQHLGPEVIGELDRIWRENITRELGFENYSAMIATLG